jgi:hypothetical protein
MEVTAMEPDDEVVQFLKKKLAEAEERLAAMEREIEPCRQEVRRLRASLSSAQTGTFGSSSVTDAEIVEWLRANSTQRKPLSSPEIAAGMSLDTRGLSRRLPRMANDGLINGSPDTGYWA